MRSPSGLVYDEGTQTVTIVDMGNRRLLCFGLKKRGLSSVCPAVPGWRPLAAAMAAGGLAVTDVESNDIWIRRKERWRKAIASEGLAPPLHLPGSIAGDRLGNWYFTDFHNNRICMQKDGRFERIGRNRLREALRTMPLERAAVCDGHRARTNPLLRFAASSLPGGGKRRSAFFPYCRRCRFIGRSVHQHRPQDISVPAVI